MALNKQNLAIPFSTGIDTKTDPLQVMPTNLIDLQNAVFTLDKRLTKRNGFSTLTSLPDSTYPTTLTTFAGNLTAIGNSLQAYNESNATWVNHGRFQPVQLSVLPIVRASSGQSAVDIATNNKLLLTVYDDSVLNYVYQVSDVNTGQILIAPTALPSGASQARAFAIGSFLLITFLISISATPTLQYIAINVEDLSVDSAVTISSQVYSTSTGYDGVVNDNNLYMAWNASDSGGAIRLIVINQYLAKSSVKALASAVGNLISLAANSTYISLTYYTSSGTTIYQAFFNPILNQSGSTNTIDTSSTIVRLTSTIDSSSTVAIYYEIPDTYVFDTDIPSHYIKSNTCTSGGTVGTPAIIVRSVGLASKAFTVNGTDYMLAAYQGQYQPAYFLIDDTGFVCARIALSNGGGYATTQVLCNPSYNGNVAQMAYLYKDLLESVATNSNSPTISPGSNIYTQTGVNLVTFNLAGTNLVTAEIGNNLNIAGGFLWAYDGALINEQGFHLWPENLECEQSTGGHMADQTYYYQVTYEWTDAQGNLIRSAPSIPLEWVVTGGSGNASVKIFIPTLRLTYKPDVRIVIYRWSTGQQNFYQVTSITSPTLNDKTVNYITYTDTLADGSILGNNLLYTTGGVVENIPGPACSNLGLFGSRLMVVDSEDQNLLWYSKQVIESTPVEMSDLFTIYTAPTLSSQGSTGPTLAVSAMDDKFIAFKENAIYYINGTGPDNTGANNDFSSPTFITSTVGCANQPSIVFTPMGLIFESDKGQWLLGRDLSTSYIGAAVEKFNADFVSSSVGIPGTNQVRLCLNNNLVLMYDYYYQRWATFTNIDAISSCIYQGLHTYLDSYGNVLQETPGQYLDNTNPVLMAFTTAWMNLMSLQGFQRAYMVYILGNYISPHKLNVSISYDYANGPSQAVLIDPSNYAGTWGSDPYWGQSQVWGGASTLEQWRIFLNQQKMQAFQVTVQEQFDPSYNTVPGAGLTISGLNLVVGSKKGYVPLPAAQSVG